MLNSLLLALACWPSPWVGPPACPLPVPGVPQDIPDQAPEIEELLGLLAESIASRGAEDTTAVDLIEKLGTLFPRCGPRDRAAIARGVGKCLAQKRKDLAEGQPDNSLFVPAAKALGRMGKDATKILVKWVEHKAHRKNLVLRRELIQSLGLTGDPAAVKCLGDQLQDDEASVIAWSAESLGRFEKHPQALRKRIFEDILKVLVTASEAKEQATDLRAGVRWERMHRPMLRTLAKLTGEQFQKAEEWQRWWNKNKRSDWDAMDGEPSRGGR